MEKFTSFVNRLSFLIPNNRLEWAISGSLGIIVAITVFWFWIYLPVNSFSKAHPPLKISTGSQTADSLICQAAYLQAHLELSKSDSCYLVMNLGDSTMNLYMRGVVLKTVKFQSLSTDKTFMHYPDSLRLLPFTLESCLSSIVKHPIAVKKAPKDTSEANLAYNQPFSLPVEEVFFTLNFDKSLVVEVSQLEKPAAGSKMHRAYFRKKKIQALLNPFKSQEHRFRIKISIPKEDARAIYRALPQHAGMFLLVQGK